MSTAARVTQALTFTSLVGAAFLAAPAAQAATSAPVSPMPATVGAAAHVRYTVSGSTATITPYVTGTQHEMQADGKAVRSALPASFELTLPPVAKAVSGNMAGDAGSMVCSNRGAVPLSSASLSAEPIVVKFPGPGTYPVSLRADVCTDQGAVTKTVNITIPGSGSATSAPKATGAGPVAATSQPTKGVGPKVNTDQVKNAAQGSPDAFTWGLAGMGALGAAAGAGVFVARRRQG